MFLENVADSGGGDDVAELGHFAHNPVVAPSPDL